MVEHVNHISFSVDLNGSLKKIYYELDLTRWKVSPDVPIKLIFFFFICITSNRFLLTTGVCCCCSAAVFILFRSPSDSSLICVLFKLGIFFLLIYSRLFKMFMIISFIGLLVLQRLLLQALNSQNFLIFTIQFFESCLLS